MNKYLLLSLLIAFSIHLLGQTLSDKSSLAFDRNYQKNDTLRTLLIGGSQNDECIQLIFNHFGEAEETSLAKLQWTNVAIKGIGENLTLSLINGYFEKGDRFFKSQAYKSEEEKLKIEKTISKKRFPELRITVKTTWVKTR